MLLSASSDVTASLRRTHDLMAAELQRSQFARETLEASTRELTTLSDRYSNLDTLLASSRSLVGTLIHSRKSDTWYLETTMYILLGTIAWLVFRRILYGPGWWLIYLPLRFIWWISYTLILGPLLTVLGMAGKNGADITALAGTTSLPSTNLASVSASVGVNDRGIPTFQPDSPRPSVNVGGGGHGAKAEGESSGSAGDNVVEDVGRMAERGQQEARGNGNAAGQPAAAGGDAPQGEGEGTHLRERTAEDGPPNAKKRMWEEPAPSGDRPRDEL